MLPETEQLLLDLIANDALASKLRKIGVLPFQSAAQLQRYVFEAPGVYLNYNESPIGDNTTTNRYTLLCASRNARGFKDATHGDGKVIGAYEIADRICTIVNNGTSGFKATRIRPMRDSLFDAQGVTVVGVDVENQTSLDDVVDLDDLDAFITYAADHLAADPDAPISQDEVTLEQS